MRTVQRPRRRATRRWGVVPVLALLAMLPGAADADDPAPVAVPEAAKVSATLDHPFLTIDKPLHRAHVKGRVTGVTAPGGLAVLLEARSPNYHLTRTQRTTTDSKGRYAFSFQPVSNSTLRVTLEPGQTAGGFSRDLNQYIFPRVTLHIIPADKVPLRVGFSLAQEGPALITFDSGVAFRTRRGTARSFYFYAAPAKGHTFTLVAKAKVRRTGCKTFCEVTADTRVPLTKRLHDARRFLACAKGTVFKGLGVLDPSCGKHTVRR